MKFLQNCNVFSLVERRLIALVQILILPGGQYSEKGLVLNLPSNVQLVANQLPQSTRDVNLIGVKYLHESHVADEEWKYFACPSKLLEALNWLKANNKL